MISTMNQAIAAINAMNRTELDNLMTALEGWFGEKNVDRRRKRGFCRYMTILNWDEARMDIIRMIYNAQAN